MATTTTHAVLTHWCTKPLPPKLHNIVPGGSHNGKPKGFWLSDESDHGWIKWCEDNDFLPKGGYAWRYDFSVDLEKILWLKTEQDLRLFNKAYGKLGGPFSIHWPLVGCEYKGILITPYQWGCRLELDMLWYCGWDCASACIWDVSCLKLLKKEKLQPCTS